MGPSGWTSIEQRAFLNEFAAEYQTCRLEKKYQDFWRKLFNAWIVRYPLVDEMFPGRAVTDLDDEETREYGEKLGKLQSRLKEWFRWQFNPRTRTVTAAVTRKVLKDVFKPRRRNLKAYEVYAKLYPAKVAQMQKERCSVDGTKGSQILAKWHSVCKELLAVASDEEKQAVEEEMAARAQESDDEDEDRENFTPEQFQKNLDRLPSLLSLVVDAPLRNAGQVAFLTFCGPVPEKGGQIEFQTLQFGDQSLTPCFAQLWPDHEASYVNALSKFVRHHEFSPELCARRSMLTTKNESQDTSLTADSQSVESEPTSTGSHSTQATGSPAEGTTSTRSSSSTSSEPTTPSTDSPPSTPQAVSSPPASSTPDDNSSSEQSFSAGSATSVSSGGSVPLTTSSGLSASVPATSLRDSTRPFTPPPSLPTTPDRPGCDLRLPTPTDPRFQYDTFGALDDPTLHQWDLNADDFHGSNFQYSDPANPFMEDMAGGSSDIGFGQKATMFDFGNVGSTPSDIGFGQKATMFDFGNVGSTQYDNHFHEGGHGYPAGVASKISGGSVFQAAAPVLGPASASEVPQSRSPFVQPTSYIPHGGRPWSSDNVYYHSGIHSPFSANPSLGPAARSHPSLAGLTAIPTSNERAHPAVVPHHVATRHSSQPLNPVPTPHLHLPISNHSRPLRTPPPVSPSHAFHIVPPAHSGMTPRRPKPTVDLEQAPAANSGPHPSGNGDAPPPTSTTLPLPSNTAPLPPANTSPAMIIVQSPPANTTASTSTVPPPPVIPEQAPAGNSGPHPSGNGDAPPPTSTALPLPSNTAPLPPANTSGSTIIVQPPANTIVSTSTVPPLPATTPPPPPANTPPPLPPPANTAASTSTVSPPPATTPPPPPAANTTPPTSGVPPPPPAANTPPPPPATTPPSTGAAAPPVVSTTPPGTNEPSPPPDSADSAPGRRSGRVPVPSKRLLEMQGIEISTTVAVRAVVESAEPIVPDWFVTACEEMRNGNLGKEW